MTDLNASKTHDLNDAEAQAERDKVLKIRALVREKMLKEQLSQPSGRAFYWDLLSACHVFESIMPGDEATTNFLLGERNVGLRLMHEIMAAAPESFIQMLKERGNG